MASEVLPAVGNRDPWHSRSVPLFRNIAKSLLLFHCKSLPLEGCESRGRTWKFRVTTASLGKRLVDLAELMVRARILMLTEYLYSLQEK